VLGSDGETHSPGQSPKYQESNDSSSTTDTNDGGGGAGDQYHIEPSSGGTQIMGEHHKLPMLLKCILFFSNMINVAPIVLGEADFTHATQDTDHGAPSSQMITMIASPRGRRRGGGRQHHLSLRQSTSSIQSGSEPSSFYAHGYPEYLAPDPFTMCNGCMSGRVRNSTPCWSLNGKQPPYGWGKLGTTTRQA
jgi:hypothetical protein